MRYRIVELGLGRDGRRQDGRKFFLNLEIEAE